MCECVYCSSVVSGKGCVVRDRERAQERETETEGVVCE